MTLFARTPGKTSTQKPSNKVAPAQRSHLVVLEARMMFDGAAVLTAADVLDPTHAGDPAAQDQATHPNPTQDLLQASLAEAASAMATPATDTPLREIAFVDASLPDVQQLIAGLDRSVEIVLIDANRDGVAQIAQTLAGRTQVDAVHLLSHGSPGEVRLGTALLTTASIAGEHADELATIKSALADRADLLIYGCDAAEGVAGMALVRALADSTGAEVAASTDTTGAASRGGDWELEVRTGDLDVSTLSAPAWDGTLVQTTINPTGGTLLDGSDGLRVYVTNLGQMQVTYQGVTQLYGPTYTDSNTELFNGMYLAVGSTVVGTNQNAVNLPSIPNTLADVALKSFGAQTLTGSGTAASPYVVTTTTYYDVNNNNAYNAATDFKVEVKTSYEAPNKYLTETVTVTAPATNTSTVKFYHTLDTYLAGGDNGPAFSLDPLLAINGNTSGDPSFVGVRKGVGTSNESMVGFAEVAGDRQFDHYYSGLYNGANLYLNGINNGGDIINTWDTNAATDNGLGIQYTLGALNTSTTFSYHIAFDGTTAIDLDANNSSGAAGTSYQGTFVPTSATPVAILDSDTTITNVIGDINDAAITLTNPQSGDVLTVNSALLPAGISVEVLSPNQVRLTGVATEAVYQNALQQVMFQSTGASSTNRSITISLHNQLSSALTSATTTLTAQLSPTVDLNSDITPTTMTGNTVVNGGFSDYADQPFGWTEGGTGASVDAALKGRYAFSDANSATLTMAGLSGLNVGPGLQGAGQLAFDIGYVHGDNVQRSLQVTVGGTLYATLTTGGNSGVAGMVTYLNGATNAAGTTAATSIAQLADPMGALTSIVVNLPGTVSATGTLVFTAGGGAADAVYLDNVALRTTSAVQVDATTGNDFATVYTEDGAGVSISDTDNSVRDGNSANMVSAVVTLTNAQANDVLLVGGSAAASGTVSGIAYTSTGTVVTLTGSASRAAYTSAIAAITFRNTSDTPATGSVRDISVVVNDGVFNSNTAHSLITVVAVNDAPVAANDSGTATEDTTLAVSAAAGLLANDTDPEGSALSVTQFTVAGDPTVYTAGSTATLAGIGAITLNTNGSYSFSPAANYTGAVPVITYTVSDGGLTDTATLTLGITAVNDAPVTADDTGSATEDTPLAVSAAAGLLANDADIEGAALSITQFTVAGNPTVYTPGATAALAGVGTLTVNADGSYAFTPAANYTGAVPVVTYTVSDGSLTDTATLTLGINAVNDAPVATDDTATATEDTVLSVSAAAGLLANDSDVEGSALSLTQFTVTGDPTIYAAGATATLPGVGTLTLNADGSYAFSPAANYTGAVPVVTYTVSDGSLTDTATLTLGITAVNDAPVAADDTATATEDTPLSVSAAAGLLANDADVEGSALSLTQFTVAGDPTIYAAGATATLPGVGMLTVNADGSYSFSPAANYTGTVPVVTYTVSDGSLTSTATLTLGISAVNDAPVASDDTATATEDTVLSVPAATGLLANDSDVEGAALSLTQFTIAGDPTVYAAGSTATVPGVGSLTVNANGSYAFSPAANYTGAVPVVTYTVSDGSLTDTATLTLGITAVNDAPVTANDTATATEDTPLSVPAAAGLLANDSDVEGSALSLTQFTVAGDPTIYAAGATATLPGVGTLNVNADGSYSFSPAANYTGTVPVVTYTVSDGSLTSTATLTLGITAVNDAPVATDDTATATEDTVLSVSAAAGLLANDSDVEGSALSLTQFTVTGDPTIYAAGATATLPGVGTLTLNADGSYAFSPAANYTGAVPVVTYTVSDGSLTDTATLTLGITAVNDAPVAADDTATATEDTPLSVSAAAGLLANDADVEGAALSLTQFTVAGDPTVYAAGSTTTLPGVGTLTVNANGSYSFFPAANYTGAVPVVTYTVSDGSLTSTATLTLGITAVNDAPVASDDTATATEDTVLSVPAATGLLANDSDVEGAALSLTQFTIAGDPTVYAAGSTATVPVVGSLTVNADGSYAFTPAANYTGAVPVVTYTVSDGSLTSTATLMLGISAVNDAPVATDDTATATEDTVLSVSAAAGLLANDADVEGSAPSLTQFTVAGDPTVYAAGATVTLPGVGSLAVNADGSYAFSPATNYTGAVPVVTYTVSDGSLTDTATLTLGITAVNDAPVTANDTATATEDTPLSVPAAAGLLANDSDVEGSALSLTQFTVAGDPTIYAAGATATLPGVGTLTINADGSYAFSPAANYTGPVPVVTYTVSDGSLTDTATLTLGITAVNDAPVATDDTATATEDTVLSVNAAAGLLANDSDVEGAALSITQLTVAGDPTVYAAGSTATVPGVGTLTINADGSYAFSPAANYTGPVPVVTYTVSDGSLTDTATLTLGITAVNDAPTAVVASVITAEDTPTSGAMALADVEGDTLTVTLDGRPAHGQVLVGPDGTYTYTPDPDFNGADQFTATVSDGHGGVSTTVVNITMTPLNDAPTSSDLQPLTSNDGEPVSLDVRASFADRDGDTLTYAATGLPDGLQIDATTGTISGTLPHDASTSGPYTVVIQATDGDGLQTRQSFTWAVRNVAPVLTDEVASTPEDTAVTLNLLANDRDPDGDALHLLSATAEHGTVRFDADGTLTYVPQADYHGTDTVRYVVSDGMDSRDAVVQLTVTPVNDAPTVAAPLTDLVSHDRAQVALDFSTAFADRDAAPLVFTAEGLPAGLSLTPEGLLTGIVASDASVNSPTGDGRYTVTVTATDSDGASARQTFAWQVRNTAPVAVNDAVTSPADQPLTFAPMANDTDADGDALTLTAATATHGTVTVHPNGTFTYQPGVTAATFDTVRYTITDAQGGTSTAEVRIELTPVTSKPLVEPAITEPAARAAVVATDNSTLSAPGVVVATVNRIQNLNGLQTRDAQQDAIALPENRQAGFDNRTTDSWIGSSLKLLSGAGQRQMPFSIDTEVRRETVQISFTSVTTPGRTGSVSEYQFLTLNGRPLPAGILVDPHGSVTVTRVPGMDKVTLLVRALRTDGGITEAQLEVEVSTGTVQMLGASERAQPAPSPSLLSTDLERLSSAQDVDSEALAVALGQH